MKKSSVPSRRRFLAALGFGAGAAAARSVAQVQDVDVVPTPSGNETYRDPATGGIPHRIGTLLQTENFISAYRFFTEEQIADAREYRGRLDLTEALQTALDAAWSTNRDIFLPAGLYRVHGLVLPGGLPTRSRAFRFYGQGSGELFARGENGGTIVKGIGPGPVLANRVEGDPGGHGNQEVAYIRFEGDSSEAVLDFATLFAQSELHHCGIFQNGSGDGVRVRYANTIELHHNYVLNRDWAAQAPMRRTGIGIRVGLRSDNGLLTLRKNTVRGFDWAVRLGGDEGGRLYSSRIEQCEASTCTNGFLLCQGVDGAVVDNCYFEGGGGGVAIQNRGNGNILSNNFVFPGFTVAIDDADANRGTRIVGNTLSAGNRRTISAQGCTLTRVNGENTVKTVESNSLICDPVSFGRLKKVVGIEILGRDPGIHARANFFDPRSDWGQGPDASQIVDRSGRGVRGALPFGPDGAFTAYGGSAISLARVSLTDREFAGQTLRLPPGSWFEVAPGPRRIVRSFDGAQDGRLVILSDRHGLLSVEPSPIIHLSHGNAFAGPGTLTLLLDAAGGTTQALELARCNY